MSTYKVEVTEEKQNDFAEYMWMEDLEKFDKEMTTKIAEDDYIRSSIEMLLEEEERSETIFYDDGGHEYMQKIPDQIYYGEPNSNANYTQQNYNSTGLNGAMENPYLQYQYQNAMPQQNFNMNSYVQSESQFENSHTNFAQLNLNGHFTQSNPQDTRTMTSTLNPNATPFFLNPKAKEFVPKSAQ